MKCSFCPNDAVGRIVLDKEYPICRACGDVALTALRITQGAPVSISYACPCENVQAERNEQ